MGATVTLTVSIPEIPLAARPIRAGTFQTTPPIFGPGWAGLYDRLFFYSTDTVVPAGPSPIYSAVALFYAPGAGTAYTGGRVPAGPLGGWQQRQETRPRRTRPAALTFLLWMCGGGVAAPGKGLSLVTACGGKIESDTPTAKVTKSIAPWSRVGNPARRALFTPPAYSRTRDLPGCLPALRGEPTIVAEDIAPNTWAREWYPDAAHDSVARKHLR
jgi:hypothetical protein